MFSYEKKDVLQLFQNSKVKIQKVKSFTCYDRFIERSTHDKRETVVIFERYSGTAHYTFQRIIGYMYR